MTLPVSLLLLGFVVACGAGASVIFALLVDLVLDERQVRRTGHEWDCPAPRGWQCTCRDSRPDERNMGGRDRVPPARVHVLPNAGPPAEGNGFGVPGL